jgi:hypothetical protein
MARREPARRIPARYASLALALSILCLLLLAGSLPAAVARHTPKQAIAEVAPAAQAGGEAPVAEAGTPAARPRRHERPGAAPQPVSGAGAPAARTGHGGQLAGSTAAGHRRERRNGARGGEAAPAQGAPAGALPSGQAAAQVSSKTRREREREQRRRERERRTEREGHRETRKEREAREAREHEEAAHRPAPETAAPTPVAAALGAAPATAVTPAGTPPRIVAERAVRATGPRHTRALAGRGGKVPGAAAPASGAVVSAAAVPRAARVSRTASRRPSAARSRHGREGGSELVKTVTRIIGVVPSLLWLLVGGLGLLAGAFALSSRLAARRARRLSAQRQALLDDVGLLQGALLPALPARLGTVATSAAYRPASGPAAGGDFYDVFGLSDGRLAVIVGDVSGHGREALPHTTLLRFTLRAYIEAGLMPREALRTAAPILERQLGGSFATVVLSIYDPRARTLTYACAGHPHPVLTGLAPDAGITACSAPPIGAGRVTGTRQTVIRIEGATVACFYTDGVIEARTADGLFGVERLAGSLAAIASTATAATLLDRVSEETDRRPDDMAACLLRIEGEGPGPLVRTEELELDRHELDRRRVRRFLAAAGLSEEEAEATLAGTRTIVAEHGSALLSIRLGEGPPRVSIDRNNVAPLRARAIARTQEVAI